MRAAPRPIPAGQLARDLKKAPFAARSDGSSSRPHPRAPRGAYPHGSHAQHQQHQQRGLFRVLLLVIALGVTCTLLASWYMRAQLPVAQQRAKETEALFAPPSPSFCQRTRPPMVCAHGGDTSHAPPNTASAFRASLAAGADCVEIDAALSRDGVLVVMHVRELAQLLGRKGVQVGDLASEELLALRWPSGDAAMSVEEAVRLTAPYVDCVTLDVKTYNDQAGVAQDEEAISRALVALVASTRCANCMVWAKSDTVVRRLMELDPGLRTGYIVMNETEESRRLGMQHPLRFAAAPDPAHVHAPVQPEPQAAPRQPSPGRPQQPAVVGAHFAMVEPQLLESLHGAGKQLFAWTVNEAAVLRTVLDVAVDALVTNYPTMALEAIDSRLTKCGMPAQPAGRTSGGGSSGANRPPPPAAPLAGAARRRKRGLVRRVGSVSEGDYL